jgi:hypothetical protein
MVVTKDIIGVAGFELRITRFSTFKCVKVVIDVKFDSENHGSIPATMIGRGWNHLIS